MHLDGSLRVETLIELAEKEGLGFNRQTIEETFKDKYLNLEEYLGGFQYTVAVMQNAEVCMHQGMQRDSCYIVFQVLLHVCANTSHQT